MSDETKPAIGVHEYAEVLRKALSEFSGRDDAAEEAKAAEERQAERIKSQLAANDERFARELEFRERMVAMQLRAEFAATILAALIQAYDGRMNSSAAMSLASDAVAVADVLRAELEKAAP